MVKRVFALVTAAALAAALGGCAQEPELDPQLEETTLSTAASGGEQTQGSVTDPSMDASGDVTEPVGETTAPATTPEAGTIPSVPQDDDFVRVLDYIPLARQQLMYATKDNFTGTVIYDFQDAYLRYGTVKKLMEAQKDLQRLGYTLLIWDAYRPVYAQQKLFDAYPDPTYVSPPGTGNQNHCRGRAVDVTIVDMLTGEPLEMPTGFDEFSAKADRDYSDVSPVAACNAQILADAMERNGFKGYSGEWWHFNDTDEYPIEEVFDPAA